MEINQLIAPIHENKIWFKILGVISIVYGAFLVLSIVGILFAWIPIWLGVLLYQIASKVEAALSFEDEDAAMEMMEKIGLYFKILGILTVVGVVLSVLVLMFFGTAVGGLLSEFTFSI